MSVGKTGDSYKDSYICFTQVYVYGIAYFPFHSVFHSVPFSVLFTVPRFSNTPVYLPSDVHKSEYCAHKTKKLGLTFQRKYLCCVPREVKEVRKKTIHYHTVHAYCLKLLLTVGLKRQEWQRCEYCTIKNKIMYLL